jgi:hypothetical protein
LVFYFLDDLESGERPWRRNYNLPAVAEEAIENWMR